MKKLYKINLLTVILLSISLFISGCFAEVKVKRVGLNGVVTEASYTRWGNQAIGSFTLDLDGTVSFSSQKSDTEIAFNLGALSATVGGEK